MALDVKTLAPALKQEVESIFHWYPQAAEAVEQNGNFEYRPHACSEVSKICLHDDHTDRFYEFDVMRGVEVRDGVLFDVRWHVSDEFGWSKDECSVTSGQYAEFKRGHSKDALAKTYVGYYTEVIDKVDDYLNLFSVGALPVETLDERIRTAAREAMGKLYPPCPWIGKPEIPDIDGQLSLF